VWKQLLCFQHVATLPKPQALTGQSYEADPGPRTFQAFGDTVYRFVGFVEGKTLRFAPTLTSEARILFEKISSDGNLLLSPAVLGTDSSSLSHT
jgi:hypothetical protein